jgi:hypothetical protein
VSVHGEYSRALTALIERLKALDHRQRDVWIGRFESAQVSAHPDLSAAARVARRTLASIEADAEAREVEGLADPRERLEAHCRAILGSAD